MFTVEFITHILNANIIITDNLDRTVDNIQLITKPTTNYTGQIILDLNDTDSTIPEEYRLKITEARNKNKDVIGWIAIEDFNIDYPVLYSTDNKAYLRTNISGDYDVAGCIYLDANYGDIYSPIKLIHGHNMHDGTMFASLPQMLHWSNLDNAPIIMYCDDLGLKSFKIFSIFSVNSETESVIVDNKIDIDKLDEQKSNYLERSWVPVSEVPSGLELLMLNTCWYGESGKEHFLHCIVVAVRIS